MAAQRRPYQPQQRDQMNHLTAIVGLIAGFLTLVTAVLGFMTINAQSEAGDLKRERSSLRATVAEQEKRLDQQEGAYDELTRQYEDAQQRVRELEALQPPVIEEQDSPAVRSTGTIVLAQYGDSIDLNATQATNWDQGVTDAYEDTASYQYDGLSLPSVDLTRLEQPASFTTCGVASGWEPASGLASQLDLRELESDQTCLRLTNGRIVTIQVIDRSPERGGRAANVTLKITTWDLS
jgi:cell division protein FtsL